MGENHFAVSPSALYGVVLLMAAIVYWILQQLIITSQGRNSLLYEISEASCNNYQGVRPVWDSTRFGDVQPNRGISSPIEEKTLRSRISVALSMHPAGLRASIFCMDWHSDRTIVSQGQT
jgi:hypothetical protein